MMGITNPTHVLFLLVIGLLLFGAKRLPEAGRSLGSGLREFKDSLAGVTAPVVEHTAAAEPAADLREAA